MHETNYISTAAVQSYAMSHKYSTVEKISARNNIMHVEQFMTKVA